MLSIFLVTFALVAVTVAVHAVGLAVLLRALRRWLAQPPTRIWPITRMLIPITWCLILLHLMEISVWALFYLWQGCLPDAEAAFYFAGVTYTSLGYGDLVLAQPWRLLAPIEGLTGILMCGLSTGFLFAVVLRIYTAVAGRAYYRRPSYRRDTNMNTKHTQHFLAAALVCALMLATTVAHAADALPSWNDGTAKKSIVDFVAKVTKQGSLDFVPVAERIATFDNDGTLWCEQPMPVQFYFALDRLKALAPQHPEWKTKEPFASFLKGDINTALAGGDHALLELIMATHAGMTTVEFERIVKDWIATAKHPKTGRLFTGMVYQPMLELLAYLRANGFKNFIVSGGGIEFMRPWAEKVYGIPPEQVIGSSIKTKFEMRDGKPVLVRLPELIFNDDKADKPVGIQQHIGRRPIAAFGNSVGDKQMLEYTQGGSGARFMLLVLHDDAAREYAYGPAKGLPDVKLGAFTPALYEQAKKDGWTVVSMKDDWKQVFASEQTPVTAIDILLEPDATMLKHAEANNARLLKVFQKGFTLDATHRPHITLVQRFVRTADLHKVYAAAGKVLTRAGVTGIKLEAFKYYYIPSKDIGVAGIVARPTPELRKLQQDVIAAVTPFTVRSGTSAAFVTTPEDPVIDPLLIEYVSMFVPKSSGEHFNPHVTTGVAPREYLDKMLTEPFAPFTFSPAGAAVYQLGQFGTAAKKLKEWDLKP